MSATNRIKSRIPTRSHTNSKVFFTNQTNSPTTANATTKKEGSNAKKMASSVAVADQSAATGIRSGRAAAVISSKPPGPAKEVVENKKMGNDESAAEMKATRSKLKQLPVQQNAEQVQNTKNITERSRITRRHNSCIEVSAQQKTVPLTATRKTRASEVVGAEQKMKSIISTRKTRKDNGDSGAAASKVAEIKTSPKRKREQADLDGVEPDASEIVAIPAASISQPEKITTKTAKIMLSDALVASNMAIVAVLKKEYLNVRKRFNLSYELKCLTDLSQCFDHHKKKFKIKHAGFHEEGNLRSLLRSDKPIVFVRNISTMVMQKQFPTKKIFLLLLEHMLTLNDSTDYKAKGVVEMAAFSFSKTLENFPPCCAPCKPVYQALIADAISDADCKLPKEKFIPDRSLLDNLLRLLDRIIQNGSIVNGELDSSGDDACFNFDDWNVKNSQKYSFEQLSRKEKVQRIFLVLGLLIQLMEADLAMWMITYANQPYVQLYEKHNFPLIAHFLWPDGVIGEVNHTIKRVSQSFVNYISIGFSQHKVDIFSRLIGLIFNCLNICDTTPSNEIQYPLIGRRSGLFCDALNQIIYENPSYTAQLYFNVIEKIQSPVAKLKMSSKLINKLMNKKNVEINPNTIHTIIETENWLAEKCENELSQTLNPSDEMNSSQHYPCLHTQSRYAISGLSDQKFIDLLRMAFEAYVNIYHIDDVIESIKHKSSADDELVQQFAEVAVKHDQNIKLEIDYDDWEGRLEEESELLMNSPAEDHPIYPNDIVNKKLMPLLDLSVSMNQILQYREDIKYYEAIKTAVGQSKNDYFKDWFLNNN